MTDLEAIRQRTSRRAYAGALDATQLGRLKAHIAGCNLHSGLDISLLEDGADAFAGVTKSYGLFSGVRCMYLLAGPKDRPDLPEAVGRAGEYLVLQAVKMGLGTCWVAGTFDRRRLAGRLHSHLELVAVVTVGPVKENKGLIERATGKVAAGRRKKPDEMMRAAGPAPEWFTAGVKAAALAPSALGRQPVTFGWDGARATASVPGGEGHQLIDLGIAKYHFEVAAGGRFEYGNGAAFIKE